MFQRWRDLRRNEAMPSIVRVPVSKRSPHHKNYPSITRQKKRLRNFVGAGAKVSQVIAANNLLWFLTTNYNAEISVPLNKKVFFFHLEGKSLAWMQPTSH